MTDCKNNDSMSSGNLKKLCKTMNNFLEQQFIKLEMFNSDRINYFIIRHL